ncbi:hypothetical protein INT48_006220 [Thamnidium elegans]|uniref:Uncharacterized protein n=1 Tax=Thamnidium elegans TaxID=101142 RepID=A0A8H7ST80_9FUNG|nr:hypothetical protein INT48_006220 [Thamnidium elegans]
MGGQLMNIASQPSVNIFAHKVRMINVARTNIFNNIDQISLFPRLLSHLICLKNVALETAAKAEDTVVAGCSTLKPPAPCLPEYWLSDDSCVIIRATKKQKK